MMKCLPIQSPLSDRNGLGYIREGSSNSKMSKEMKFVKAKEAPTPLVDNVKFEKKPNVVNQMVLPKSPKPIVPKPKARGKSLPKRQGDPQTQHYCRHCGILEHALPSLWNPRAH